MSKQEEVHPEHNPVLRLVRRVVPSTTEYDGQKLFTRKPPKRVHTRLLATPLFAVLVLIEATDVIFAVDSVPAVLAVSREQFIVFASNAFAILGLRALYFLLADLHNRFRYLQLGLAVILVYVGVKMIISEWYHIPTAISLAVIAVVLMVAIVASVLKDRGSDASPPKLRPRAARPSAGERGVGRQHDAGAPHVADGAFAHAVHDVGDGERWRRGR